MKIKNLQFVVMLLAVTFIFFRSTMVQAGEPTTLEQPISKARYVTGGIFGTTLGFGLGHAINGTYADMGWVFTAGEIASCASVIGGSIALLGGIFSSPGSGNGDRLAYTGLTFFVIGSIAFPAFRIWEIVDVWARPSVQHNGPTVSVLPMVNKHTVGLVGVVNF